MRSATSRMPRRSCAMPKPRTASAFQSDRSSTPSRSSAWLHAMWVYGLSREIPYGFTPAATNSSLLSRRSSISAVHVLVQSKK